MQKPSIIITFQLFIIFALSSSITSVGAAQERTIPSQPLPLPSEQYNHSIEELGNNACELLPHLIKNKERLLWEGTTFVRHKNLSRNVYCLLTDDDKLYLFADKKSLKKPLHVVDLSQYSLVPPVSKTPHLVTLSSFNTDNKKTTRGNTVEFEHRDDPDNLRHLLRCATHKYYCYDSKQDALKRLCKDNIIDKNHYLIQFSCQVSKHNAQNIHIYCLFPTSTNITYQQLCGLFERYLNTNVERFTRYGKKTDLTQNQSSIYWEYSTEERVYSITFSPQINYAPFPKNKLIKVKESTCPNLSHAISSSDSLIKTCKIYDEMRKKDPFAEEKIDTEKVSKVPFTKEEYDHLKRFTHGHKPPCIHKEKCGAFKYIERKEQPTYDHTSRGYIHTLLFYHPRKRNIKISKSKHSPFIYEKHFASMHPLDMREENPLHQLEDPYGQLKSLILEIIENELAGSIEANTSELKKLLRSVKYITSNELPFLKKIEEKMGCEQHKKLGYPLNIAEMCAIYLYSLKPSTKLHEEQLSGNFHTFPVWDRYLMRAILKLHRVEEKKNQTLYSGLRKTEIKTNGEKGFFKIYTSTSKSKEIAMTFTHKVGMLMYFTPEMQIQFPCCDISWISKFGEEEILFARSADVGIFPAAQWQAFTFKPKKVDNEHIQHIRLSPVAQPLVVRKGKTLELPAAPFHIFSDIKIEENGTLTTEAWCPIDKKGGYLYLQCLGDCILEKNAKIDVSKKGYAGGTEQHPQGYGPGGGYGCKYRAAGGSHITQGSAAQCEDGLIKALYSSQCGKTYGKPMYAATDLSLGSGGGSIQYSKQESASGSPGGGALYLEVSGDLHVGKNAQLLANGGNAHSLSGGAGSGGSLCVQVKGKLICPNSSETHFAAQGGNNEQVCHPLAQGSGGNGNITVHVNQLHIRHDASHEKIIAYWCRQHTICNTKPIIKNLFIITAFLLHYNSLPTAVAAKQTSIHNTTPHHVTIEAHYYNAKGVMCRKKAQYLKALAYHEKALKLQTKKYGNKATHPAMIETYGHKGATLAAQGNYRGAIATHQEELKIARQCYQKTNAAHPKLLQAYTHLGIAHHGQGEDIEAMKYLKKAIQVSEKANANKEIADVYDTRGLLHRSQANYDRAMQDHQKAANIRKQLYNQKAHSDTVTSYKHIGQTHHAQGNNTAAIASYQQGLKMWQKLYPNQPHHPDSAAIDVLLGDVYHSLGQYKQAINYQEKALISYNKTYAKQNHPDIADTLLRLGQSYDSQGDYDLATYYYKKAIQMLRILYKQQDTLDALFSYPIQKGISQENVEQFQQWLELHNFDDEALLEDLQGNQADANIATYDPKIYSLLKRFLQEQAPTTLDEPFHPAIADALEQQGNAYLHFGNATKALQNHQKAYAIRKLAYSDPAHPKRIASYNNIARFHLHQKQYEEALQTVNKGIQIWEQHRTQAAHPIIALTHHLCGLVYYNQAQYASARKEHKVSLSIHEKLYGEKPHPAMADDYHAIADTYAKEGEYKGNALPYYKKALERRQKIYHDIPYHPSIADSLSAIGTTYAAIGESDQAIENHVKATRCKSQRFCKENQIDHTLTSLYVHTNASRAKALEEEAFPLHPRVKQFIDRPDHKVLLLHGDAGAGKSLYGRFLEDKLWKNYKNNQSIIPLFISLPALKKPIDRAVKETLIQYGWDNTSIQALQKQSCQRYSQHQKGSEQAPEDDSKDDEKTDTRPTTPRLLIFFDEYNEINTTQNLYETNQLAQWGAKVIIGCRTEYLDNLGSYQQYFQANAELYIRPFNPQQIDTYLDRIDTTKQPNATETITWRKDQYKAKFKAMPTLQALSTSPFLLQLIVNTLPHLYNRTQITRADIYKTFIEQWIKNAVNRMEQQGMENISQAACWQYGMEVALFMFLHERVTIQAPTTSFKETELCNHFSKDKKDKKKCDYTGAPFFEEANTLFRKALPLKQLSKNTSSFLHQSIQEYCAAQALLQSVAQLSPRSPNELTTYFAKKVKAYDPITNKNTPALNQKLLNAAPAIIHFLGDELAPTAQYPAWKESLFAIIEASKKNSKVAIAAANSATILNAGGILLHDKDWAKIRIPHALLDHAFLARTNLKGANLMGVSLRQAYLEGAQLQKANVQNIQFGEYPTLPHPNKVYDLCWSPDGEKIASISGENNGNILKDSGEVQIWDGATGRQLQQCTGDWAIVNSVTWSPGGKYVASPSRGNNIETWDVATGKKLQQYAGHKDDIKSVSCSPDEKYLASASLDKSVRIWEVNTDKLLQQYAGHKDDIKSVSWSPDEKYLASASLDKSVRIWEVATGRQLQQCTGHTSGVYCVRWSHDNDNPFIASGSADNTVRIWEVITNNNQKNNNQKNNNQKIESIKLLQICEGHTDTVNSVVWSPKDKCKCKCIASASKDKSVRIWEVATGRQLQQCTGHTSGVESVSWSPDGTRVVSGSSDYSVRIWDVATGNLLQQYTGHTGAVMSVGWAPDEKRIASASQDKSVRIWEVAKGNPLQQNGGHITFVNSVSWSPDNTHVAVASGLIVGIWNVVTGKPLQQCKGHTSDVRSVSWSPDGKQLASASGDYVNNSDNSVRIWNLATGKQLQLYNGHTSAVMSVSWLPDGKRLASASKDKSVRIWEVATGKLLQKCAAHTSTVWSVSCSPDGKHLASASGGSSNSIFEDNSDYSVRIWDAVNGNSLQQCTGHTSAVYCVRWSHDNSFIASASADNTVRIWKVIINNNQKIESIKLLQICEGHTDTVNSVAWSPNDKYIASASKDKSVRIWEVATGKLLQQCTGHTNSVESVSWSRDGKYLASASKDKSVRIWEVATGKQLEKTENVKKGKVIRIITNSPFLTLTNTNFIGTIGLSEAYRQLVQQRGGVMEQEIEQLCKKLLSDDTIDNTIVHKFRTWLFDHEMDSDALHWDCEDASSSNVNAYNSAIYIRRQLLVKQQWNSTEINTSFLDAVKSGELAIAKQFRQLGANKNAKDKDGKNALHMACYFSGSEEMVTWLLDVCKIDKEAKDENERTPLLCAANKGQLTIAKRLKEQGANPNTKDKDGKNALHLACYFSGSEAMVTWLLDVCKIDIETKGQYQMTPFLFAARKGELGIAKLLKKCDANINAKDKDGDSALHLACLFSESAAMVTWLLDKCKIGLETKGYYQKTPFLCAANKGQLTIAKRLKERGADVNSKSENGNNALHMACRWSGSVEMTTWLVDECKIDLETKGQYQKTPFLCAAEKGQVEIAKRLKEQGANINGKDENGNNALHYACLYSGSEAMVTWLLDVCKIDIETKGQYQMTPFLFAARKGELGIAKLLKKCDANINAKNKDGDSALHLACLFSESAAMVTWLLDKCKIGLETKGYYQKTPFLCAANKGQLTIAKRLKERGADVNSKSENGNNALHMACRWSGSVEMTTWLVDECKIDLETKGQYQKTPFLCAAEKGQVEIAKRLKEQGANINGKDENGNNALHYACLYSGSEAMVTWLLDVCKIDIETKGQYQMTPFLFAARKGELGIAKLLKKCDANINAKDKDGDSALHLACLFSESAAMVTWLLDKCKIGLETKGYYQKTPFLCAANKGQLTIAKRLKERGADVNSKSENGNNALHMACRWSGSVEMTTWLVDECKIDLETKGQYQKTPFLCAAEKGQVEIAKRLKEQGANLNGKDENGNNALHYACLYSGSVEMATWLLDVCKIGIESKGFAQRTPFLCAAEKGQLAIAKRLKERGAHIHAKDEYGNNALDLACLSGSVEMRTWLVDEFKIDVETKGQYQKTLFLCAAEKGQVEIAKRLKERRAHIHATDNVGNNALHMACLSGSVEMTTWLLDECKLDIETKGQYEKTPFLFAAYGGQLPIAKLLKERSANIHAKDKDGDSALHLACLSGNVEMTKWLLDKCKIDKETKGNGQKTPFLCAAEKGQVEIAKRLKKRDANLNAKDEYGNSALHLACGISGSIPMVTWLLDECKMGLETKGFNQRTPFLCAAEKGQVEIAKPLKKRDANLNAKDEYGNSALHLACGISGSIPMVTWLLDECKMGLETKGFNQRTPFLCAAEKGQVEIAKRLKERGANIHAKDEYGNNALDLACLSGSVEMVKWLIETRGEYPRDPFLFAAKNGELEIAKLLKEQGANLNAKDEYGNSALHLACLSGSVEMVKWLIETRGEYPRDPFLFAAKNGELEIAKRLKEQEANLNAKDKYGNNALHLACGISGSIPMVTWLLDVCKLGIETKKKDESTPFLCAVQESRIDIAKLLRKQGANLNAKDKYGNNALNLACYSSGSVAMVTWLLDECKLGLETKRQDESTPFPCAAEKGQLGIAKRLRRRGANVKEKDENENNALNLTSHSDSVDMTRWPLDKCKIGIETKGLYQRTPFLCAAEKGQLGIAKRLRRRGANVKEKDENGNNALHMACLSGSVKMTNWLLNVCNIGIETKGEYEKTPFLFAVEKGQLAIAKLLKERGANIHAKDAYGNSALHMACLYSGSVKMINWLLNVCNIGIETKGEYERTPFLCAAQKGQFTIAKLLKEQDANPNAEDKYGNNALHMACLSGSVEMTNWLLNACSIGIETKGEYEKTPFLFAVEKGQLAIAKLLKERDANIHAKDSGGENALHYACNFGSVEMTTWLLDECKIDLEAKGEYERTPFLCAAQKGQFTIAKLLKEQDANPNAEDKYGNNALNLAFHSGSVAMVTWLLDECKLGLETKRQDQSTPFSCAAEKDENGNNALHWACLSGSVKMTNWLLNVCNIGIETKGEYEKTPFLFAVEKGQLAIAELLKERGANIHAKDAYGNNALHWACLSGSVKMTNWLLNVCNIGIETKGEYEKTPFLFAVEKGQLAIAELLKERGANIHAKDAYGNNALHWACLSGSVKMTNWLLNVCNIGIETKGEYEKTPFLFAVEKGQLTIAKRLKEQGANIHAKDAYGNNALHWACLSGSVAMVTWLLDVCKIGIETKGEYEKTPFLFAVEKGQLAIAELLKERGANIHAKDAYGNNALHMACLWSGSVAMVTWLLDVCKIGIEAKGNGQQTPFLYAAEKGQLAIAELLKERGANIHAKDAYGNSALHMVCLYSGSVAMVTWLLDVCKIGIEAKGNGQQTPFLYAAEKGQVEIAKRLKEQGANIHAKDAYGNNALHFACLYSGSVAMVTWLLDVCKMNLETKGQYQITPFLCAAQNGHLEIAMLLKKQDAKINAKNAYGNNALHLACLFSGSVEMTRWLLDECKIGIETEGLHQRTPFLCAAEKGQLAIAKLLRKRHAKINAKDAYEYNALDMAFYSGSVEMARWLIETRGEYPRDPFLFAAKNGKLAIAKRLKEQGADLNAKDENGKDALQLAFHSGSVEMVKWLIETRDEYPRDPFLFAAKNEKLAIAKRLKEQGVKINAKDEYGNNALHWACLSGNVEMIPWLLDGCNVGIETKGEYQKTPFLCAAQTGQLAIAELLKERGADINAEDAYGNNALHYACLSGGVEMTNWLLDECKIPIETKGYGQKTPFLCAAEKGQLAIAKLLRKRHAKINAKDEYEKNALDLACLSGSVEMVKWLIETRDEYPRDPFLFAAKNGKLAIAKRLKEQGANINIHAKDEDGKDALQLACFSGSVEMVKWLIETRGEYPRDPFLFAAKNEKLAIAKRLKEQGADVNAKNRDGNNALHFACLSGNVKMTRWLLDVCKMGLETKGKYRMTTFLVAAQNGHLQIAMLLKKRGAKINVRNGYGNNASHLACLSGSAEMTRWLLVECKIGLETEGDGQMTSFPFMLDTYDAYGRQVEITKLLKEKGANLNAKDKDGNSALGFALSYENDRETIDWSQTI